MDSQVERVLQALSGECQAAAAQALLSQQHLQTLLQNINQQLDALSHNPLQQQDLLLKDYLRKIGTMQRRLEKVNDKMFRIQTRVEKIEKKYECFGEALGRIEQEQRARDDIGRHLATDGI